jgi:hypothetical protein
MKKPVLEVNYHPTENHYWVAGDHRYTNLTELGDRVRRGFQVKVTETGTGNDVTREVLIRILMKSALNQLPVTVLHELVLATDPSKPPPWMIADLKKKQEQEAKQRPQPQLPVPEPK